MGINNVPARKHALYKIGYRRGLRSSLDTWVKPKPYNSKWFAKGIADGERELKQRKMHELLTGEPVGAHDFKPRHIK